MIIEEIMCKDVISLNPYDTIQKAIELIVTHNIRHMPVIDENSKVIGMVSDRDVRDASPSIFHSEEHGEYLLKPVSKVMTEEVITGHPLDFVEEVATIFYEHDIGCLPIVSEERLVGIVTETDLLHTLVQLMGADIPSSRVEVRVKNKVGSLSNVLAVFRQYKVNIISVFVYPEKNKNSKILVFRIQTMNPMVVISKLKKEGFDVLWPNFPGVQE